MSRVPAYCILTEHTLAVIMTKREEDDENDTPELEVMAELDTKSAKYRERGPAKFVRNQNPNHRRSVMERH